MISVEELFTLGELILFGLAGAFLALLTVVGISALIRGLFRK